MAESELPLATDDSNRERSREDFVRVCALSELEKAQKLECAIDETRKVLVLWTEAGPRAYQAECPHESVQLMEGVFDGEVLTCLEHLWQFDARTGCALYPEGAVLGCFAVRVSDGDVWVSRTERSPG